MTKKYSSRSIAVVAIITLALIFIAGRYFGRRQHFPEASDEQLLTASGSAAISATTSSVIADQIVTQSDDSLTQQRLDTLRSLTSGVFQVQLQQQVGSSSQMSGSYRVDVSPGLTIVSSQALHVITDGVEDTIDLPPEQRHSYTTYISSSDTDDLTAITYTYADDHWVSTTQTIPADQQSHTYAQLWTTASEPVPDEEGRLTAPGQEGGTYHFYFSGITLTKVTFTTDDQVAVFEYNLQPDKPDTNFPQEIARQATPTVLTD